MKLYVSPRAPSPRRVTMFMAEKGMTGIELVTVEIGRNQHRSADYLAKSPLAKVPVLVLDDGRVLGETRAICTYLEGLQPDGELAAHDFVAGARFTIGDITAFCALEFARGLMKFHPGDEGMPHLQAWRDRTALRPSARAGA